MKNTPKNISIEKLFPFEGHPFKVQDNEEMNALIESIQEQGILSPLIVRPKENTQDEYEIVSGHRRFRAAGKAGMKEIPALIVPLDRDEAAIAVVPPRAYFTFGKSLRLQAENGGTFSTRKTLRPNFGPSWSEVNGRKNIGE